MTLRPWLLLAVLVLLSTSTGCSMQAWYGGVKFAAENECRRQPPGETQGCLARLNTLTYEEYERKRSDPRP